MSNWVVTAKRADFHGIAEKYDIDPVTARILVNREIKEEEMAEFLHPSLNNVHEPNQMKDMERAVSFVAKNLDKHIRVIGDYDIDGIFSTYLLLSAIRDCGGHADHAIPDRILDGYGINPAMVEKAKADGVNIIITCDNGISAFPAAERARELGIDLIITDHHQIPFEEIDGEKREMIPPAYAVIDPHQKDCPYPYPDICGGMVAWKFMGSLFAATGKTKEDWLSYLEYAAFATVGDIMPLLDENRIVVKWGLTALKQTKNPGLRALLNETGLAGQTLSTHHVGFVLGPCFNATGRLKHADIALSLLLEEDEEKAKKGAAELVALNERRKAMTQAGDEAAMHLLEEAGVDAPTSCLKRKGEKASSTGEGDSVFVLYIPDLHESLCGLVAGHIKEKYYRPTFVLCDGEHSAKGSGRSIEAYSMFEKMSECKDLLLQFGGHPMAAGLSIAKENIDEFRRRMNENANLSEKDLTPKVKIDVPMPLSYVSERLIEELDLLEPFGTANEKPSFAESKVAITKVSYIGKEKQYLKFSFLSEGRTVDGLYFGDAEALADGLQEKYGKEEWHRALSGQKNGLALSILYYPQINEFNGNRSIQVVVKDYQIP